MVKLEGESSYNHEYTFIQDLEYKRSYRKIREALVPDTESKETQGEYEMTHTHT